MTAPRKIPMHRGGARTGSPARTVSRPGVSTTGEGTFQSPYQPPPAYDDLAADAQRGKWHEVDVADQLWHVRVPGPEAVHELSTAISKHQKNNTVKSRAAQGFIHRYMREDDFDRMVLRLADPDDSFHMPEMFELLACIATTGTARPFPL